MAPLARPLIAALSEACADLAAAKIRFALVGELAVSARAEPRLTRDVDVAVAVADDTEAEQVIRQLVGQRYRVITLIEHTRDGRISTVRRRVTTAIAHIQTRVCAPARSSCDVAEDLGCRIKLLRQNAK